MKKTILFIVEDANLKGGTEILTFNLVEGLHKRGMGCFVLSLTPYRGGNNQVISLSEEEWLRLDGMRRCLLDGLSFRICSDNILKKILSDKISVLQPSVVVCQTYDIITALPSNNMFVTQVLNWSVRGYEASLLKIINQKRLLSRCLSKLFFYGSSHRRHAALSKVSKVVVLSRTAIEEIKELNPCVKDSHIAVIPDPLNFTADSEVVSSLKNNNVVFVGRLSHEKGVMRLLRIWERVSQVLRDYTLSIYGDGIAKREMEIYVSKHNIQRVLFKGFTHNLAEMYTNADLLLMTSETEGFGMVLTEAMYYGVPCISFDCPVSPKEIIADAGLIVDCYDEDKYADAVLNLLQNPEILKRLQQKSIKRARDFYMDVVLNKWMALIC